jgi:chemotaxis protein MotB
MKRTLIVLALLLPLAACVSKKELEKTQADLTAREADLEACRDQAKVSVDAREEARRKTAAELGTTSRELEECRKTVAAAKQQTDAMKAQETDLRSRLQSELTEKNVEIERLKDKLSLRLLDKILFRSGSATILPEGLAVLDKVAAVIGNTHDLIRIEGHTDDVPISANLQNKYPSNWELSSARASSVVRYFMDKHKIDPARLEAVGLSEYRPVAPNDSDANRQRNRRVAITLSAPPEEVISEPAEKPASDAPAPESVPQP